MNKKYKKEKIEEKDVDELLETLWSNLETRRKCEKTHIPNYIKRELNSDQ